MTLKHKRFTASLEEHEFRNDDFASFVPLNVEDSTDAPETIEVIAHHDIERVEEGFTKIEEAVSARTQLGEMEVIVRDEIESGNTLSEASARMLKLSTDGIEAMTGIETYIPEASSFNGGRLASHWTEVTMESIVSSNIIASQRFMESILFVARSMGALFTRMTPVLNKNIDRANKIMGQVNNSNREAGLKEIHGAFVSSLSLDGRVPEPKTIIENLGVINSISIELLSRSSSDALVNVIPKSVKGILAGKDIDDITDTGSLYYLIGIILGPINIEALTGSIGGRVSIPKGVMPALTELYPVCSKISLKSDDPRLTKSKSVEILGGKAMTVTDLDYGASFKSLRELGTLDSLSSVSAGFNMVQVSNHATGPITTLTSREQAIVIGNVIELLTQARQFYKGEQDLLKKRYMVGIEAMKQLSEKYEDRNVFNLKNGISANILAHYINWYTRLYWKGLLKGQKQYISYLNDLTAGLTTYVLESLKATQADAK